jgi:hypothetical protein
MQIFLARILSHLHAKAALTRTPTVHTRAQQNMAKLYPQTGASEKIDRYRRKQGSQAFRFVKNAVSSPIPGQCLHSCVFVSIRGFVSQEARKNIHYDQRERQGRIGPINRIYRQKLGSKTGCHRQSKIGHSPIADK